MIPTKKCNDNCRGSAPVPTPKLQDNHGGIAPTVIFFIVLVLIAKLQGLQAGRTQRG
jgi:hypothetical protein